MSLSALIAVSACTRDTQPDAYGNFEAEEVVVAAETSGQLRALEALEGRTLTAGVVVGQVDTLPLSLERAQIVAQRAALTTQRLQASRQIDAAAARLDNASRTLARTDQLLRANAATAQQRDAAERDVRVLRADAAAANAGVQRVADERAVLDARIASLTDRIRRATIINPVAGTVLAQYARSGEMIAPGQPLYRIASLDTLTLRAYVTGGQLASIRLGGTVSVTADGVSTPLQGTVSWIAARAEFTPTPVQTRDERADLVYAVKIRVPNRDGALKIGMPADVTFNAAAPVESGRP
jgi:HlyD family secretion protein